MVKEFNYGILLICWVFFSGCSFLIPPKSRLERLPGDNYMINVYGSVEMNKIQKQITALLAKEKLCPDGFKIINQSGFMWGCLFLIFPGDCMGTSYEVTCASKELP